MRVSGVLMTSFSCALFEDVSFRPGYVAAWRGVPGGVLGVCCGGRVGGHRPGAPPPPLPAAETGMRQLEGGREPPPPRVRHFPFVWGFLPS